MKLFLNLLLIFMQAFTPASFAGTKTLVKADILEGNVADIDILGNTGHFEKNALSWVAYDDAAADPVDATGGTSTTTCARTTTTPIDGDGSLLMTKTGGASYQGEGCALTFTVPANLSGEPLQISFEYKIDSGTYADDAVELWLYNVTGTTLIQPAPTLIKNHTLNRQTYRAEFQPTYSTSAQTFRLALHIGGSDTTAYALKLDNFRVYKGRKSYGSVVTDWVSYTPTITHSSGGITNYTATGRWRQNGDTMEVDGAITFSGASAAFSGLFASLPSGRTIDTSKLAISSAASVLGFADMIDAGVSYYGTGLAIYNSTVAVEIRYNQSPGTGVPSLINTITNTIPFTFGASDTINWRFKVPITGWSSSQVMSSDADTRVVALNATSGSTTGTTATYQKITGITSTGDTHGALSSSTYTVKVPGWYKIKGAGYFANHAAAGACINQILFYVDGSSIDGSSARVDVTAAQAQGVSIYASGISNPMWLNAGQTIEWYTYQNSGQTRAFTGAHFGVERISGPSQIMASETVSASFSGTATTSMSSGTTYFVDFPTKIWDTHGSVTGNGGGSLTSGGFTFTAPISGLYQVRADVLINSATAGFDGAAEYGLLKSVGTDAAKMLQVRRPISTEQYPAFSGSNTHRLLAGQTIQVSFLQTSGGALAFENDASHTVTFTRIGNY